MMNIIIRKAIFVIILGVLSPFFLSAQQKNTASQKKAVQQHAPEPVATAESEEEVDPSDVLTAVREVVALLKTEKEKDPAPATLLMSYANSFAEFSKYSRIETDTKISVVWYKNVSENLSELAEIKLVIEVAELNKEEEQLKGLKKTYKEYVSKIIDLLEHPKKLSEKK
ncbi:MAG: hypothetical protein NT118_10460 [Lentisphaerae bacterium]|nr:hypothetical protein [Lentisphaerota bacterium]